VTLTRSASSSQTYLAAAAVAAVLLGGCRQPQPPTLAEALRQRATPAARSKALLRVAVDGAAHERERAWFLVGLAACDADAAVAAAGAFAHTRLEGGRARLAVTRLEAAIDGARHPEGIVGRLASIAWLRPEDRLRLRIRVAEVLVDQGARERAIAVLPADTVLTDTLRERALLAAARAGGAGAADIGHRVAIELPLEYDRVYPGQNLQDVARSFTPQELNRHAAAWLAAGRPAEALRAASRAGGAGALTAARAALRLRRATEALVFARRVSESVPEGWLERGEALRVIAWAGPTGGRQARWREVMQTSERALDLAPADGGVRARATVLRAEALVELGQFGAAATLLAQPGVSSQSRWEWVTRRLLFLAGTRLKDHTDPLANGGAGARLRHLGAYWQAHKRASAGDLMPLKALADSGFPDLPTLWSAARLKQTAGQIQLSETPLAPPGPPTWAADLLNAGRVADVALAWRSDLEAGSGASGEWLGLATLAKLPALETIPLLIKGEPRLLAGPWRGLPRALLELYLPLQWRDQLEAAADSARVPPWLLAALVRQESAWNPHARSAAGAVGLAQVLPDVAAESARRLRVRFTYDMLLEPDKNLMFGALELAQYRRAFGGSWIVALAAYNAGERRIRETWVQAGRRDGLQFVEAIELPETHDYVHRVALLAEGYRILYWPGGRPYPWT
jgi:soluble lytic murein transglycosylase